MGQVEDVLLDVVGTEGLGEFAAGAVTDEGVALVGGAVVDAADREGGKDGALLEDRIHPGLSALWGG